MKVPIPFGYGRYVNTLADKIRGLVVFSVLFKNVIHVPCNTLSHFCIEEKPTA